jgi:RNA polymerase sigma-70 factor (ECF subfamily)
MFVVDEDELALVAGLRAGDAESFSRVYHAYRPRLFGFLIRMTGDRAAAEDLLQEAWLRLARRASALRPDTNIGAWLFTVARNLVHNYRRSRFLDDEPLDLLGKGLPANGASPLELASASELESRLEQSLAMVPVRYREVLLLVGVGGMAPAAAASVCQVKPEALRQRLARARALLIRCLDRPKPIRSAACGRTRR